MGRLCKTLVASLLAVGVVGLPAYAQDRPPEQSAPNAANQRTAKERLGPKWTDEQRIDNCNVPPDKRGTKPRPAACPHVPTE
jgi:hypothetical protein